MKANDSVFEAVIFGLTGTRLDTPVSWRIVRVIIVFLLNSCTCTLFLDRHHLFLFFLNSLIQHVLLEKCIIYDGWATPICTLEEVKQRF